MSRTELLVAIGLGVSTSMAASIIMNHFAGRPSWAWILWTRVGARRAGKASALAKKVERGKSAAIRYLVRWLAYDQDLRGLHFGEFGRSANISEETAYQRTEGPIATKPRLYLTGWPCRILHLMQLGDNQIRIAIAGVSRYQDGLVTVPLAAGYGLSPTAPTSDVSVRHSLRVCQILSELSQAPNTVSTIVGRMMDPTVGWQLEDGGWVSTERLYRHPDLWSSAYAASLLSSALSGGEIVTGVSESLDRTVEYLVRSWSDEKWAFGEASAAQNGLLVLSEVLSVLAVHRPALLEEILDWCGRWLLPTGVVSRAYLDACRSVTECSANARFAYVYFLAGESRRVWQPLLTRAIDTFGLGMNAADVAFMLHMIHSVEE